LEPFESIIKQLTLGFPIGAAMEYANTRYAEISTMLTKELEDIKFKKKPDALKLASWWTANNDARSYVIIGDPAVKLPVGDDGTATERPTAEHMGPIVVLPVAESDAEPQAEVGATAVESAPAGGVEAAMALSPSFTLGETVRDAQAGLEVALKGLMGKLTEFVNNALSVEVRTYVSDRIDDVKFDRGEVVGAHLRAVTHIAPDGRVQAVVPAASEGGVDEALWKVHDSMVTQARANREALLRVAASAAKGLLDTLKP
jgi:hypothetical protein